MADQNTALPVRTEADGTDERLHVKIVDGLNPSLRAEVDTDKNVHVEMHGNDPAGVDRVVRTSEAGALTPDGVYNVSTNTKPGNSGLIASTRDAAPSDTTQTERITSVTNGTKKLLDVSMHDENGAAFSNTNPLPVTFVDSEGVEVNDYNAGAAIAAAASSTHDYLSTGVFVLTQVNASASGKMRAEIQVETGPATGVFTTRFVQFNSTAKPNVEVVLKAPIRIASGVRIRVIRRNLDNQAQDLYSTISGNLE